MIWIKTAWKEAFCRNAQKLPHRPRPGLSDNPAGQWKRDR